MRSPNTKALAGLLLSPLLAGLHGCGQAGESPRGSILARVNGAEISAQQAATRQALEKIIDRELLVQKALDAGLDRDPAVRQSIDTARRELLAQAWLQHAAASAAQPGPEEARAFYRENPALFAERRIYQLRELVMSSPPELAEVLRTEAASGKDLDELAAWLRSRDAKFRLGSLTQPAEQLPLSYLPRLSGMKQGEIAVFPAPPGAAVIQLLYVEEAPLSEPQAAPLIERFLAGRRQLEIAAAEIRRLREAAKIEYLGALEK